MGRALQEQKRRGVETRLISIIVRCFCFVFPRFDSLFVDASRTVRGFLVTSHETGTFEIEPRGLRDKHFLSDAWPDERS